MHSRVLGSIRVFLGKFGSSFRGILKAFKEISEMFYVLDFKVFQDLELFFV